jgi:hypothetical protein
MPAFRIVFEMQTLPAEPAVVHVERNVGFACQPHQPLGRQLHVQRHRDPPNDTLLGFEPVIEAEAKAFAPDIDTHRIVFQHHHHVDFGAGLIGGGFDTVLKHRIRRGNRNIGSWTIDRGLFAKASRGVAIDHAPFAEAHQ